MEPVRTTNIRRLPRRGIAPGRMARRRFAARLFVPTLAAKLPALVPAGTATGFDETDIAAAPGRAGHAGVPAGRPGRCFE